MSPSDEIPAERANFFLCNSADTDQNTYDAVNCISNDVENKDNKGMYGVDATCGLRMISPPYQSYGGTSIRWRHTLKWFAEAIEGWVGDQYPSKVGIPKIVFGTALSGIFFLKAVVNPPGPVTYRFRIAYAGAATMPASVQINAISAEGLSGYL